MLRDNMMDIPPTTTAHPFTIWTFVRRIGFFTFLRIATTLCAGPFHVLNQKIQTN